MREQLVLIDDSTARPWRLDERTRVIGRRGVEHARRALQRQPEGSAAPTDLAPAQAPAEAA